MSGPVLMRRLHCPFDGLEAQACLVLASDQLPEPGSKPRPSIFSAWGHDRCLEACCLNQDSNQTCPQALPHKAATGSARGRWWHGAPRQGVAGGRRLASPQPATWGQSRTLTAQLALAARRPQLLQPSSIGGPGCTKARVPSPRGAAGRSIRQAAAQPRSSPRR